MAYSDFQDELISVVATATGTTPSNTDGDPQTLFTSVEAARLSIVEFMNDALAGNRGRPAPPYVAVQVGSEVPEEQYSADGGFFRSPVTIAYIDATGNPDTTPDQKSVHAAIEAIRSRIDAYDASFETFWRVERGAIDTSDSNVVFRNLASDSKVQIVAGTLTYSPGLQTYH